MSGAVEEKVILNLGCGEGKVSGATNVDINSVTNPDLVCDIRRKLPFDTNSVDEILFYHTIEHIEKRYHQDIFRELNRILKPNGILNIAYPEFLEIVENWKTNYQGKKDFWEMTIYGAQRSPSDFHVVIMHTPDVKLELIKAGFRILAAVPEPLEKFNTYIRAAKDKLLTYEDILVESIKCQPEQKML